ncbi:MAG TPA: DUF1801 domain-containing protein [Solirubrobacteraceae bacterium]|jgi:hypothetical protein
MTATLQTVQSARRRIDYLAGKRCFDASLVAWLEYLRSAADGSGRAAASENRATDRWPGSRSALVERSWPSLMNVGPGVSSRDLYVIPRSWLEAAKRGAVLCGAMAKSSSQQEESPSQLIDARIEELGDWRGTTLSKLRALIKRADPEAVEEWKWKKATNPGVPVWSHNGIICTGETYKSVVKLTFFKGASLEDPSGLFNSSLEGNVRRAIDFHEADRVDENAFVALIRAAVSLNDSSSV